MSGSATSDKIMIEMLFQACWTREKQTGAGISDHLFLVVGNLHLLKSKFNSLQVTFLVELHST